MAWYFIVDTYINEEKGRGEYDEYINAVKPIVESYGGKYLVIEQKLPYLGVLIKKDEDLETVVRMNL